MDVKIQRPSVLVLTHRVPYPPDRGDRVRSWRLINVLAGRAAVDVACFCERKETLPDLAPLRRVCRRLHIVRLGPGRWLRAAASLVTGRSITEGAFAAGRLARQVIQWHRDEPYHAVLAYCSSMFRYGEPFAALGVPLLVDLVDVDSQKWWQLSQTEPGLRRWLYRIESRRLRKLESHIAAHYLVSVVSRRERELLHEVCPSASVHVVANGVELEYFAGIRPSESVRKAAPTCLFLGVLNYTPNVQGVLWFAENVWPSLKAQLPQARWLIVGKSPVRQVEALARMPGVSVHADVPDVRPWLEQAHVAIAPLLVARGLQNKVLEAMAAGRSVVATRTALDGLDTCEPPPALAADNPQQWLAALAQLLGDDAYRWPLEEESRRYAERHYDYRTCMAPFLRLLGLETTNAAYHPAAERQVLAES